MTTIFQDRPINAPIVDAATKHYWDAASEGKLLVRQCTNCGMLHWYPRSLCPYCMSDRLDWKQSAGRGSIYSVSITRRAGPSPYAIAYVRLHEGITMLTNIVDCDLDSLRINHEVRLCFKPAEDGRLIPMFTPI